jgi:uncharacterized protein (TIGR02147 family)
MEYREILQSELNRRRVLAPAYSLRAFSKYLGISPAQLSQVISGKRKLTAKAAAKIADRLALSPIERMQLVDSATKSVSLLKGMQTLALEEEVFRFIAEWYHLAILSCLELPHAKAEPRWIAKRLGISALVASQALNRLKTLNLVEVGPKGFKLTAQALRVTPAARSQAVGKYHQQVLAKASAAIDEVPIVHREVCTLTIALNPRDVPKAKQKIAEFMRSLGAVLESGEKKAVYALSVQLFPLTKEPKNENRS